MVCSFAEWRNKNSEADPKSILYMMEGDCGPEAGMNWTLIGIIWGSVWAPSSSSRYALASSCPALRIQQSCNQRHHNHTQNQKHNNTNYGIKILS